MSKQIASPYVLAMTYKARDAKTSSLVFISEPQGHARSAMTCKVVKCGNSLTHLTTAKSCAQCHDVQGECCSQKRPRETVNF